MNNITVKYNKQSVPMMGGFYVFSIDQASVRVVVTMMFVVFVV